MKQKYDFGERKVTVKSDNLLENTELKEQYDFVTENAWASATKAALGVANTSYARNAAVGAGAGAVIGGVGGVLKNATKRDDDPTKKGFIGAALGGAGKGATVGTVGGIGARAIARSRIGQSGIQAMSNEAIRGATNGLQGGAAQSAAQKTINMMNSGAKGNSFTHSYIGIGNDAMLRNGVVKNGGVKGAAQKAAYKLGFGATNDSIAYTGDLAKTLTN